MADNETFNQQPEDLPLVLVHRLPSVNPPFKDQFLSDFNLLDPRDSSEPPKSFLSRHAHFIRALITIGLSPLTDEFLHLLPCLELVVAASTGVDHIDLQACWSRGITVANCGSAFSENVADCAIGLLIDVLRRISASDRFVRGRMWPVEKMYPLGFKLGGKRIGIVGLGNIGSEIAKRLLGFGCSIAYNSRKKKQSVPFPFYANICDLAANSDVLMLCCALTEETHHIINKDVMVALGKEGVIINVGRGNLIDEKELVQCLVGGVIGGAGLDVFESEPHVPEELLQLDNVVLSPHCSALTPESFKAVFQVSVANLKAFFSDKPLLSAISRE